jgi:polyphosphate kinase
LSKSLIINRELSWLSFNERVLQEAACDEVPILERLKFIGIFSNNMDEFFRVRVATIRRMLDIDTREAKVDLGIDPILLLKRIQLQVYKLQETYENTYHNIIEKLESENIFFINEKELDEQQGIFVKEYFHDKVRLEIFPILINNENQFPVLQDSSIYLTVRSYKVGEVELNYSLIEVPSNVNRFLVLPKKGKNTYIMFLDDVIRYNLKEIYKIYDFDFIEAYTLKFTKDAELDIDNDVSQSFLESIELSLKKRRSADALRLIYDAEMPSKFLEYLLKKMDFDNDGLLSPGVRYHNFKDFTKFPSLDRKDLLYPKASHVPHANLEGTHSIIKCIQQQDILLYYPYHSFDYFLDLLREAAIDPLVSHIRITIYRVANDSNVIKSLVNAVRNGKDVTVVVELRARFDEAANIKWANRLRDEGVKVITGISGLKVHSKLCLITRREDGIKKYYGCFGTGNFNEKTAKVYTDTLLMTANQNLTKEARELFTFFDKNYIVPKLNKLLVAPFNLRNKINSFIAREIRNSKEGKRAEIFMKMNSLVDIDMIGRLYNASKAGVKVRLIVRGMNSLIPELPMHSENIQAISIIDKHLEHARFFVFYNNNKKDVYLGSADLMTRNLDFRIEVLCPILDSNIKEQILDTMELQWADNTKSRKFDKDMLNNYKINNSLKVRSQDAIFNYFKDITHNENLKRNETSSN